MNTIPFKKLAVSAVMHRASPSQEPAAFGTVTPGTPGEDVTCGLDNDNADEHLHPAAGRHRAAAHEQHGRPLRPRQNDDLLIGNLGSDTLVAGPGADILIGGPDNFAPPNNDVLLGETGQRREHLGAWRRE